MSATPQEPKRVSCNTDLRSVDITPTGLAEVLSAHCRWLHSHGLEGSRAAFGGLNLSGCDLAGADLRHADFGDCKLEGAILHGARLNFADLSAVTHLLPDQLAGTDLAGARLPPTLKEFDRLAHIEELTLSGRKVFFIMLLSVAYTWLTVATTSDVHLLTNSATSPLPIILTKIPISGFYWVAPLVLLGMYLYFHLHLQRLWEDLAALPAIFPDGVSVDSKALPWMLTGLVNSYIKRLRDTQPAMLRMQNAISVVLAWYSVPVTIAALWLRFLPRHDWFGTAFHVLILMLAALIGVAFYRLAVTTLTHVPTPRATATAPHRLYRRRIHISEAVSLGVAFVVLPVLSYGALMHGEPRSVVDPRHWVPETLTALGSSPYANFKDMEVSLRPDNWSDATPALDMVKGVNLKAADLYRADASGAFLAKADLRGADLQKINLELANLQGARLHDTNLNGANLLQVDLRESDLSGADLQGAALVRSNLAGATMHRAVLRDAFLNQADLRSTDLYMADLRGAHFERSDLRGANLTFSLLGGADLRGADLRGATGLDCDQYETALSDADTRFPDQPKCPP